MNDAQKRREQLLKETRSRYQSSYMPAVHPRYRAAYHGLYGGSEETAGASESLSVRILISLILFAVFATADYHHDKVWKFSTSQITAEISRQPELTGYLEAFTQNTGIHTPKLEQE
ncbi:MAG: hypothetical protein HFG41_02005 [Coprococcus sp.]|nr:hypothetical protein [Coprococcus sp.]